MLIKTMLAAVMIVGLLHSASAKDYTCQDWAHNDMAVPALKQFSVMKRMIVYKDTGASETVRLSFGTLRQNTYLEEHSAFIVYGNTQKRGDGTPEFGPNITVQRVFYDPEKPEMVSTTCEATQ